MQLGLVAAFSANRSNTKTQVFLSAISAASNESRANGRVGVRKSSYEFSVLSSQLNMLDDSKFKIVFVPHSCINAYSHPRIPRFPIRDSSSAMVLPMTSDLYVNQMEEGSPSRRWQD